MKRRWAERLFSLFLMALAVSAYWQTMALAQTETRTGLFTGPAFFPRWLSILLFLCPAIIFGKSYLQAPAVTDDEAVSTRKTILVICIFFAIMGVTLILIPLSGWFPAQFFLVFIIEAVLEKRKWTTAIGISAIAAITVYAVFEFGLGVRLPRGFLE
jgi:hypothetical protein